MKRLGWLLRVAFHDWMWEGGHRPDFARRMARTLPLYFSDPHAADLKAFADESLEWSEVTWKVGRTDMFRITEPTTTLGGGATFTYRHDG